MPSSSFSRRSALRRGTFAVCAGLAGCTDLVAAPRLQSSPTLRWSTRTDPLVDHPAPARGRVYVATATGVAGLDRETGRGNWHREHRRASIGTAPRTLFVWETARNGPDLVALDTVDHEPRWTVDRVQSLPAVHVATAIVPQLSRRDGMPARLSARDIRSGRPAWSVEADRLGLFSRVDGGRVFLWVDPVGRPWGISAIGLADGTVAWHTPSATTGGPLAVAGGTLVAGSERGEVDVAVVEGLDPGDGRRLWRYEPTATAARPRAWTDDRVFLGVWDDGPRTDALDPQTGDRRWEARGESIRAVADGLAFLESANGGVISRDAATGESVWDEPLADDLRPALDWQPGLDWHAGTLLVVTGSRMVGLAPDTGRIRWRFAAEGTLRRYWRPVDGHVLLTTRRRIYSVDVPT